MWWWWVISVRWLTLSIALVWEDVWSVTMRIWVSNATAVIFCDHYGLKQAFYCTLFIRWQPFNETFLSDFPHISTDLQLFTLDSNFPSSEESNAEDGTSGKLTGLAILSPQNVPFRWFLSITSALRNHTSVSVVLYRKQPAIPHEASVQRILRVWMRSAKIYWSSTRTLVTQT